MDLEAACPTASRPAVQAEGAALALVRLLQASPGDLDVVALGPLTNLALAIQVMILSRRLLSKS